MHPGTSQIFELHVRGTPRVAIDETGVYWDGTDVSGLDMAFFQGIAYVYPIIPPSVEDVDPI